MTNYRTGMRSFALVVCLAGGASLHAQAPPPCSPEPCITTLQSSGPVGGSGPIGADHGSAITVGTFAGAGFYVYVNGSFNPAFTEQVNFGTHVIAAYSATATQVIAAIPNADYATAASVNVSVKETNPFNGASTTSPTSPFTVNPVLAPVTPLPNGVVGVAYSQAFFTGGTPLSGGSAGNLTVSGTAPDGLSFTANTGNPMFGTPAGPPGSYSMTNVITDSWGNTLTLNPTGSTLNVYTALSITTASLPNGVINTVYPNTTLAGAGGATPYNWSATGLPAGVTLNAASGLISGTPTVSGPFTANITLTDGSGQTATKSLSFTIFATLTVTTASLPNGVINTAYPNTTLAGAGGATPYNWTVTGLPTGVTVNAASGLISGTPTVSGPFTANITLTDTSGQTATKALSFTIFTALSVTTASLPNGVINTAYTNTTLTGAGGATPYNWSATGLPTGVTLNAASGLISGTPTVSGPFTANITLTDASGQTATKSLSFTIFATLTVTTASLPNGVINTAYPNTTLAGAGGATPYNWAVTGLPTGLTVNAASGLISGTPTVSGPFTANITLTDTSGQTATKSLSFTIATTLAITSTSLPNGVVNTAYTNTTLTESGGAPAYNWSATGLPAGLTLSAAGLLSGTPTVSGNFTAAITLTDSSGQTATKSLSFTIFTTLTVTTSSLPNGVINTAYPNTTLAGGGGATPYNWAATGLPAGLTLNAASGLISGTPTVSGAFTANITLTDASGQTATKSLSFTIFATLTVTTASLPNGVINTAYPNTTLAGAGGATPYNWAVTGLPTGVSVNAASGLISGTPTVSGAFTANITLTDASGQTATKSLSFTIFATLTVTTASLPNGVINNAYPNTTLTGAGGATPYNWTATGLPAGLTLNAASGLLSGTPTVSGNFTAAITLTDASGQTAHASLPFTISATLTITTTSLPSGRINTAYSTTLSASGGATPYNWTALGLPSGLTVNAGTGVISGTPTQSGNFTVNVTLTDNSGQTAHASLGLTINSTLVITTTSLPNGRINTAYSTTLAATGGVSPYNWSATGLPAGLNVAAATGLISGTPTQSGNFTVNVTLTDSSSQTANASFNLNIVPTLTITTASVPNGRINTAYSTTLLGAGGATPYNWAATGLPAGLTLNPGTGVLSGTPTVSGNFTASVTLTDASSQTATAQFPFTIFATLTITTASLPNGRINTAYPSTTLAATGGATPYNWTATGLPAGLTLNPGTGVVSGTPTVSGNFTASVTLTDASSQTATAQFSFIVYTTLTITTSSVPNGRINTAYSTTLAATGGATPYNWSATGLPAGVTLNAGTGVLSGTPTVSGNFTASVTLTDASSQTATAQFTFTIYATLTITTAALPNGQINIAYSATLAATGGATPYAWSATGLPAGIALNTATGVLSGTPTQSGIFTAAIILTDASSQTAKASLSLNTVPTLIVTTTGLPSGSINQNYGAALSGAGGTPPYTWAATGLPSGLSLNPATGTISGIPGQLGGASISVTLTDTSGQTARAVFGITVSPAPIQPVQVTTTSLPGGTVGVFYSGAITATGGNGGPYTFTASGSLPPGLSVSNSGILQGTPTAPGSFSFGVSASDSTNNSGSGVISVNIAPAPLTIATGALSSVAAGATINIAFAATGGVPPLTFSLTGSAPTGTSFSTNGVLNGTATTAGSYSFTVTVTDSVKSTASKGFTLVVTAPPLTITTSTLPTGQVGVAYSGQFAASGGTPPYTWSGSGGGGLSVSSTGAVSGTPTAAGTYAVAVTVTDSLGVKTSGSFNVTVNSSNLTITTTSLPNGALTSPYSASLAATGGAPPYSWSASGLPAGITASSSGSMSGTPTSPGAFTVSVTVKDSAGVSASVNLALTILPAPLKITTTGITPPTLGTSFSVGFGATGGTPPYSWNASGLPGGVTISSTGTLSGTPTALGASSITVTVTDSNGQTASETISLTVILPPAPTVNLNGLPATANPATQSTGTATFNVTYPVDVTLNLTLTFAPLAGAGDPNIQFSTGGRTATLTIKAGATVSSASIGVQTGTVAGTITITSQMLATGQDITPTPAPTKTIVIGPAAPTITSVTAAVNSTGFTVTIDGFDPTRAVTQVVFTFTPTPGSNLQTTSVTIPATSLFSGWYQSSAAIAYGSQFSFVIPFTVTGNVQGISSVTVTLVNPTGTSTSMSASI